MDYKAPTQTSAKFIKQHLCRSIEALVSMVVEIMVNSSSARGRKAQVKTLKFQPVLAHAEVINSISETCL